MKVISASCPASAQVLAGHSGCVNTIRWCDNLLLSGSDDRTLKLWHQNSLRASVATAHRHNIFDAHLVDHRLISCGAGGDVCVTHLDGRSQRIFEPYMPEWAFKSLGRSSGGGFRGNHAIAAIKVIFMAFEEPF